jgi:hypothetical protein
MHAPPPWDDESPPTPYLSILVLVVMIVLMHVGFVMPFNGQSLFDHAREWAESVKEFLRYGPMD